jgi:hypothetical protein
MEPGTNIRTSGHRDIHTLASRAHRRRNLCLWVLETSVDFRVQNSKQLCLRRRGADVIGVDRSALRGVFVVVLKPLSLGSPSRGKMCRSAGPPTNAAFAFDGVRRKKRGATECGCHKAAAQELVISFHLRPVFRQSIIPLPPAHCYDNRFLQWVQFSRRPSACNQLTFRRTFALALWAASVDGAIILASATRLAGTVPPMTLMIARSAVSSPVHSGSHLLRSTSNV